MNYASLVKNFRDKRILVVGDIILDRYIWGKVERISPEAPVPVVEVTHEDYMLGGASNVASNIVSLGGRATIVGVVGKDAEAEILGRLLKEKHIDANLFEDKRPTTLKARVIAHSQQVVRFDFEKTDRLGKKAETKIIEYLKEAIPKHDAIIISDYKKGVVSARLIREILGITKGRKFISLDPKVGHFRLYKGVSLITPNKTEAQDGSGIKITDRESLIRAGRTLLRKLNCKAVLITLGEKGMCLFERSKETEISTFAKKVFDVSGAGDTVIATFTLAHSAGASLVEAAIIANHAAGIVVAQVGTATVTPKELLNSLKSLKL